MQTFYLLNSPHETIERKPRYSNPYKIPQEIKPRYERYFKAFIYSTIFISFIKLNKEKHRHEKRARPTATPYSTTSLSAVSQTFYFYRILPFMPDDGYSPFTTIYVFNFFSVLLGIKQRYFSIYLFA